MRLLAVDIGTGTQDICLLDTRLDLENAFKLVLPSPTMMVRDQVRAATRRALGVVLTGFQMGGGPSAWAVEDHARRGLPLFATPEAALTIDDELEKVKSLGVKLVSPDEVPRFPPEIQRIEMKDFDLDAISAAFSAFGVELSDLDAIAVAVFDHGAAPAGVSDRRFRFEYLDRRIRAHNSLAAFAYRSDSIPPSMSRLAAVAASAPALPCPLIVMDTAPAAVLGATLDARAAALERKIIANVGNFHVLAFRLGPAGIEGTFEHHTGEVDHPKLERLLRALADGSLRNEDVFDDMGHGALIYESEPLPLGTGDCDVVVTGPRRSMLLPHGQGLQEGGLRSYFPAPFGDMMLTGCFGLAAAVAEVLPEHGAEIRGAFEQSRRGGSGRAPWDATA